MGTPWPAAVLYVRRSSLFLFRIKSDPEVQGHPRPSGPSYFQAVPPYSGSAFFTGLPGTGKPLLLVDHIIYVPMGVCHIHCYIPPHLTPAASAFTQVGKRAYRSAYAPRRETVLHFLRSLKNFLLIRKPLTYGDTYGILSIADIRRCGGIGRHKGLKIPR